MGTFALLSAILALGPEVRKEIDGILKAIRRAKARELVARRAREEAERASFEQEMRDRETPVV